MSNILADGNVTSLFVVSFTPAAPASVAANTSVEQTFTIQGLRLGQNDFIMGTHRGGNFQAGLSVGNGRISAVNTVSLTFINNTAGAIVPTPNTTYRLLICRTEKTITNVD